MIVDLLLEALQTRRHGIDMQRQIKSALPNHIKMYKIVLNQIQLHQIVILSRIPPPPIVTTCRVDIKISPLKVYYDGWLLIDVVDNNYVHVTNLNSEQFKHKDIPIKIKKPGTVRQEEEPSIRMILDMYLPTDFMKEVKISSNDYMEKRRVLETDLKIWDHKHMSAPFDLK